MTRESEQDHDDNIDATDELPVLSEEAIVAAGGEIPALEDEYDEDTGEHEIDLESFERTATRRMPAGPSGAKSRAIQALVRDVAELSTRWSKLEQYLTQNADAIGVLREQLAASRSELAASLAEQKTLVGRLQDQDTRYASVRSELEAERGRSSDLRSELATLEGGRAGLDEALALTKAELAARDRQLESLREGITEREAALASLRTELATRNAELESATANLAARAVELNSTRRELDARRAATETSAEPGEARDDAPPTRGYSAHDDARMRGYLEEIESLKGYIAGRASHWTEMEARVAAQQERIAELENETAHRMTRQVQLEASLDAETARADSLKARIAELHAALEDLGPSHRAEGLSAAGAPLLRAEGSGQAPAEGAPPTVDAPTAREPVPADHDADGEPPPRHGAGAPALEPGAAEGASAAPDREGLGAWIDELQDALGAERDRLREREDELAAAHAEREALRARLSEVEADLMLTRGDARRLEQRLLERERSAGEQDQLIATLQHELGERLATLRELQRATRAGRDDALAVQAAEHLEHAEAPMLVCLTSDQPERHVLDKNETTIGRSSTCDIQILTHFVSREHAGVLRENGSVFIEDRGSTNGVFVNSVRVDRQELKHGDWVTIGETQFRYLSNSAS